MTEHPAPSGPAGPAPPAHPAALSFGHAADLYDRARPSYPRKAAAWLAGATPARVLELGAGTGKLTAQLAALGHHITATDPSEPMLRRLLAQRPGTPVALGTAERIPLRSRAVDVVLSAQAFHWFDVERSLPEIARVLREGGTLGLVWNLRDERIPWVRRLGSVIGSPEQRTDPTEAIEGSGLFGDVEKATFRIWQPQTRSSLRELVTSRSHVAMLAPAERETVLAEVEELYDDYGRGADGMLLPYITHCYRATIRPDAPRPGEATVGPDGTDTDALLIDFK